MQQNKVGELKLSKLFGHFSVALLLSTGVLSGGSFEDFKKAQAEEFQNYKDERDREFNNYLKEQWKAYNVYKGTPLYEQPKPQKIAPAQPQAIKSVGPKVRIEVKSSPETVADKEQNAPIVKVLITTPQEKKKDINFNFYGSVLGFDIPSGIKNAKFYPQNQKGISNFFDSAASSEYESLVAEILSTKESLNLNDWGLYLLVLKISESIFSNQDDAALMNWFLFNKLGYAVKVGLAKNHIVLMHYSKKTIYATPSFNFSNQKFYVVANYAKGSVGQLFSYEQNYPGSDKALDLSLKELPNFVQNMKTKKLSFKQFSKTYDVDFVYNQNLIDFMATYPQADYETFFNAPVDMRTYEGIANSLKKYLDGKKASDAMNFVLNFVQNSFAYERDDQQFGREKVMFAQETLYFDKSDCEDRAVLFSYLMKELFGVGVVGVKYKDHMATALNVPMQGDTINAGSARLVIADPTYINASIGQSMPKYKPLRPESFITVMKN